MGTEWQRMLAGELYDASDPELVEARRRARLRVAAYNAMPADNEAGRRRCMAAILGANADHVYLEPTVRFDYGVNTVLGDGFYANFDCVFLDCAPIRIGARVLLGPGVHLYTATHPLDVASRRAGREFALPITIGDDAWIGGRSVIGPGVTIGAGTTIGAGSVVMRDVPPGVLAVGNPCRVVRELEPRAG